MTRSRKSVFRRSRILIPAARASYAVVLLAALGASSQAQPSRSPLSCTDFISLSPGVDRTESIFALDSPMRSADVQAQPVELSSADTPTSPPLLKAHKPSTFGDFNQNTFYRNKLEFALDIGWLPFNIPFPFDFLLGDSYTVTGLNYTLVPVVASLRWHLGDISGPVVLRGDWDVTFSLSATAIPRGPETHYFAYMMGIRRNFVPRQWRVTPYFDFRAGLGDIDAKGPLGVRFAQGQNFTFTLNMGSGFRYNFSPRYAISTGLNWMHVSNLYLSQPKFLDYGINVWGPMVGIDVRLGRRKPK